MTELSFLLDLLLNHKLPKVTRDAVATRIKEVETRMTLSPVAQTVRQMPLPNIPPALVGQAPSTIAAMIRHQQQTGTTDPTIAIMEETVAAAKEMAEPKTVAIIAQTPAAAQAMAQRQAAINIALSGKPAKGETSPRKF